MVLLGRKSIAEPTKIEVEGGNGKISKRRGLSRFYPSKSQSFDSFNLVLFTCHGHSTLALAKQGSPEPTSSHASTSGVDPSDSLDSLTCANTDFTSDERSVRSKLSVRPITSPGCGPRRQPSLRRCLPHPPHQAPLSPSAFRRPQPTRQQRLRRSLSDSDLEWEPMDDLCRALTASSVIQDC